MKEIQKYNLPEHINHLYMNEASSSIGLTREVADKINELVTAYNNLSKADLEWKQVQEGTIRKGVVYMKDNLVNSLNELVELLKYNGFFDKTIEKYTKELSKRIDMVISETSVDGEIIDVRLGGNGVLYETAGESIRTQINAIVEYLSGVNLLNDTTFKNGYYSIRENGEEYSVLFTDGKLRDFHEVTTDYVPVTPNEYYTASSLINDTPLRTDKMWLCVHSYDSNKNFLRREFAIESNQDELSSVFYTESNVAYVRVMARTFHAGKIRLEKGIFSTPDRYTEGNLIRKYPLVMDGCYTYSIEDTDILFSNPGEFLEKSSLGIDCQDQKELSVYVKDSGSMWVSFNFLDKDRVFVRDNTPNRVVINSPGKHTVSIPENACVMFISARTKTLDELAVFFNNDVLSMEEQNYKAIYENKSLLDETLSKIGSIPEIKPFKIRDIAHRGFSWRAPENTLPAYQLAYEKGFRFVECDLGFTSDKVPVLLHDYTLDRTSNGTGNISDISFDDVRKLDFGSWMSSSFAGTKIPSFYEFIDLCKRLSLHPYIEVKETQTNEELDELIRIVNKFGMKEYVTFISFGYSQLTHIKSKLPTTRLGYVVQEINSEIVERTKALKTGLNDVFIDTFSYTDESMELAIYDSIPVEIWVANDEDKIQTLHPYVSGVTSDNLLASEVLKK